MSAESYRIYSEVDTKTTTNEGGTIILVKGCDGEKHIATFTLVFRDREGGVSRAERMGEQTLGYCDRTCGRSESHTTL